MCFDTNPAAPTSVRRPSGTWALVPLKSATRAKSRLAPALSAEQRRCVFYTMAQGVIAALHEARGIDTVAVVTASTELAELARRSGASVLLQAEDQGMSAALSAALKQLQPMDLERVLMVPGDLPLITGHAVEEVLSADTGEEGIVAVPDRQRLGTNALLCRPPHVIAPCFGARSFERHLEAAHAAGVRATVADIPALSLDLDCPEDLDILDRHGGARAAAVFQALRSSEPAACASGAK